MGGLGQWLSATRLSALGQGTGQSRLSRRLAHIHATAQHDPYAAFAASVELARAGEAEGQHLVGQAYLAGKGVPPDLTEGVRWTRRAAEGGCRAAMITLAVLCLRGMPDTVAEGAGPQVFGTTPQPGPPDHARAAHWAGEAAALGDAEAQALYGYVLSTAPAPLRDGTQAREWYARAAQAGCARGHLGMALVMLEQAQTPQDWAAAAQSLHVAASAGLGTALYLLGQLYERGTGVACDIGRAIGYFAAAAERNVREAQARYGMALLSGYGVAADPARGQTWLRRAALAGDAEAAAVLGDLCGRGLDMAPNYAEAVAWYRLASGLGHAAASRTLGRIYLAGVGVPADRAEAGHWFGVAARQGDTVAAAELGALLVAGVVPREEGGGLMDVFRKAAQGQDMLAMFNLGVGLAHGLEGDQNIQAATHWLKTAASKVVNAQYWYGRMVLTGCGMPANPEQGRAWIALAAGAGMVDAMVEYAHLLVAGVGGPRHHPQALALYRRAAEEGSVAAMFSVGAMLGGGHAVEEDRPAARSWFDRAAQQGHALAQLMLARYLAQGLGGGVDLAGARQWYQQASAQGVGEASAELAQLGSV